VQELSVTRHIELPVGLTDQRDARRPDTVGMQVTVECRVVPGVDRVDARVMVANRARDHRLRLLFPTGAPISEFETATTFDAEVRSTAPMDGTGWVHPPPPTFCHQGWISTGNLTVAAPGLPEAEVTASGMVALTLVRSVGWLARFDVTTRPLPAGPVLEAPGAQTLGPVEAAISLWARSTTTATARSSRAAESGLWGVLGGPEPMLEPGRSMVELTGDGKGVVLSALKPAEDGDGLVVRVLNPADEPTRARLRVSLPLVGVEPVRLDEEPVDGFTADGPDGDEVALDVPAHALRSVRLRSR
jgi:alpha-mannosidase